MRNAILFLVFNRVEVTTRVFEAIKAARPPRLYVAADGPRTARPEEAMLCEAARRISTEVDWPCEVKTLFRDTNLGCKHAVSSAIAWFFDNESEGIVLEDDCYPHEDFFQYCDELLEKYREDERIGLISGTSLVDLRAEMLTRDKEDFVFNRYFSIWGWASWRRVWRDYDVAIESWEKYRADISALTSNRKLRKVQGALFDKVRAGEIDTWDYQLSLALWTTSRLAITPRFNLIENIGFGSTATHTTSSNAAISLMAQLHSDRLSFPLVEPDLVMPNYSYQRWIERFATRSLFANILERFRIYAAKWFVGSAPVPTR